MKIKIERYIAYGDFVSLEKLKIKINEIIEEITLRQSKPDNLAATVIEWIEKREKSFTARDIYNYFGFVEKKDKNNVRQTLVRSKKVGIIECIKGVRKGVYRKITQED